MFTITIEYQYEVKQSSTMEDSLSGNNNQGKKDDNNECDKCKKVVVENYQALNCHICMAWFHIN